MKTSKGKMKSAKGKILKVAICNLHFAFLVLLSGCVSFQVAGDVQKGRGELLYGDPKVALAYFQRAAELDPNYRLQTSIFPEGIWTYVGKANYATGRMPEARKALERARTREEDNLAKLYLGLVLAQDGDREKGLREMEAGLKGVADWYDYVEFYNPDGPYWDTGRPLRKAIEKQLAAMAGKEVNQKELIQNAAFLGRQIEIEIDRAQEHKLRDLQRKFHGDERRN
jgi:tetratricopeptide (TPR) repeat protein